MTGKDAVNYFCPYANSNCKGDGYQGNPCMFWDSKHNCLLKADLMRTFEDKGATNEHNTY